MDFWALASFHLSTHYNHYPCRHPKCHVHYGDVHHSSRDTTLHLSALPGPQDNCQSSVFLPKVRPCKDTTIPTNLLSDDMTPRKVHCFLNGITQRPLLPQ